MVHVRVALSKTRSRQTIHVAMEYSILLLLFLIIKLEILHWAMFIYQGPDWDRGDEDGGRGTVGVVVRKLRDRYVTVKQI